MGPLWQPFRFALLLLKFDWFSVVVLAVLFVALFMCPLPLSQCRGLFNCFARRPKPNIGINWCCRVVKRLYDLWNLQWQTITCGKNGNGKQWKSFDKYFTWMEHVFRMNSIHIVRENNRFNQYLGVDSPLSHLILLLESSYYAYISLSHYWIRGDRRYSTHMGWAISIRALIYWRFNWKKQ